MVPEPQPPQQLRVLVVGAGAVGRGLARALELGPETLLGVWNRGEERRQQAASMLEAPVYGGDLCRLLPDANLVLVCVSDAALPEVGRMLAAGASVGPGTVVAHTSGCLAAPALGVIPNAHCASLHPLVAIPDQGEPAAALRGAPFAIEGPPEARAYLERVVRGLGGRSFEVRADAKPRYHAAAVLASNLVVGLLHDAIAEAEAAGVRGARALMTELATGAIQRVAELGTTTGLTGPIVRGDTATVERHLAALEGEARETYLALSRRALAIARSRGVSEQACQELERLLGGSG